MKTVPFAGIAAAILAMGLSACSTSSPASSSPAPSASSSSALSPSRSSSSAAAAPEPSDSNPAAAFGDGSRVELADMGGSPGEMDVLLKITAGPETTLSLGNSSALVIQPVDNANDQWMTDGAPQFSYWTQSPAADQPDVLGPGQSVCVDQEFTSSNSQASMADVTAVNVTITTDNGDSEEVSLPAGGGAGSVCGITISGLSNVIGVIHIPAGRI
jgi:hypothetical protein